MSKFVTVQLDRERRLRFDFNTISEMEATLRRQFGVGITRTLVGLDEGDVNFGALQIMFAYGLRAEDRKMTPRKAGSILQAALDDGKTMIDLVESLLDGLLATGLFQRTKDGAVDSDTEEVSDPFEEAIPTMPLED